MAGNTKLIGFMQGSKVRLERWGKKVDVEIGASAVDSLLDACKSGLPSTPPDPVTQFRGADGRYDPGSDRVVLSMHPRMVDALREIMSLAQKRLGYLHHVESYDPDVLGLLDLELSEAIRAREQYFLSQDEPGAE
jgi:hypothetical protein